MFNIGRPWFLDLAGGKLGTWLSISLSISFMGFPSLQVFLGSGFCFSSAKGRSMSCSLNSHKGRHQGSMLFGSVDNALIVLQICVHLSSVPCAQGTPVSSQQGSIPVPLYTHISEANDMVPTLVLRRSAPMRKNFSHMVLLVQLWPSQP